MYVDGQGVEENHQKAAKWVREAAMQENTDAQIYLGIMYIHGLGVTQDYIIAYALFNTAKITNNNAYEKLNLLTEKMTPAQIKDGQTLTQLIQVIGINKALG
jgi:TPR repeat protein